jgi:hypothetical protein
LTPTRRPSILYVMWGYAEGNETLVAIVVILVCVAAIAYLARRFIRRGR